jgi:hypothetical protein
VDDVAGVGTANFDNRSFRLNFEMTMLFSEPSMVQGVEKMFTADFARSARASAADYTGRSWWFRLAARTSRSNGAGAVTTQGQVRADRYPYWARMNRPPCRGCCDCLILHIAVNLDPHSRKRSQRYSGTRYKVPMRREPDHRASGGHIVSLLLLGLPLGAADCPSKQLSRLLRSLPAMGARFTNVS